MLAHRIGAIAQLVEEKKAEAVAARKAAKVARKAAEEARKVAEDLNAVGGRRPASKRKRKPTSRSLVCGFVLA